MLFFKGIISFFFNWYHSILDFHLISPWLIMLDYISSGIFIYWDISYIFWFIHKLWYIISITWFDALYVMFKYHTYVFIFLQFLRFYLCYDTGMLCHDLHHYAYRLSYALICRCIHTLFPYRIFFRIETFSYHHHHVDYAFQCLSINDISLHLNLFYLDLFHALIDHALILSYLVFIYRYLIDIMFST